jgi:MFS family permease
MPSAPANRPSDSAATPPEDLYPSPSYAWYVVGVLTLVYVFSFIDRQILNLLVRPIRRDLGISDTQMSLLMGFSFAVFYTFFGIPLGRLADSRSRRTIIAIGFAAWSLFTAGCGLARNFVQMLLMRVGVGVGEAALSPAAYSLITDYFPKQRLATAISVYSMGIYIGSGLALILGAVVADLASSQEHWNLPVVGQTRPWQVIFFVVGLPGVLLAFLMYTVREPQRRGVRKAGAQQIPLNEVFSYLWANKTTFICHNVGFALISFSNYGSSSWVPTFFIRNHGWSAANAGYVYGGIIAVFGTLGIVVGGRLADWMTQRGYRDSSMRIGLYVTLAWLPTCVYTLVPSATVATALLIPAVFLTSAPFGVSAAAIQQMMPNPMRGQASAIYLFIVNLIGLGLGPTAVAMTTDYVFGDDNAVRYSLFIVSLLAHIVAAILLWAGLKPYRTSIDRLQEWDAIQKV